MRPRRREEYGMRGGFFGDEYDDDEYLEGYEEGFDEGLDEGWSSGSKKRKSSGRKSSSSAGTGSFGQSRTQKRAELVGVGLVGAMSSVIGTIFSAGLSQTKNSKGGRRNSRKGGSSRRR